MAMLFHGVHARAGEVFTSDDISSFNETASTAGKAVGHMLQDLGAGVQAETRTDREKLCFELGSLVQRLHRSTEHASDKWRMPVEGSGDGSGDQDPIVRALNEIYRDAQTLPSFCGGKVSEKGTLLAKPVPRGDLEELREHLTELQAKLSKLSASLAKSVAK
jgi:hypothetical protein